MRHIPVALLLAFLFSGLSRCQDIFNKRPIDVTISDLARHPKEFDGKLLRVQGVLVLSWEGDNFLSDPDASRAASRDPDYLWFYYETTRGLAIYAKFAGRSTIHGSFTGYFHFLPNRPFNRVFDPGPLQFEAIDVSVPKVQSRTLSEAIRDGDLEETRRIRRSKPNLDVLDEYKFRPLLEAIPGGYAEIVDALLAAGADPNLGIGDDTPLMMAAWNNQVAIAKSLLDHGARVNASNHHGSSALTYASQTCPDGKMVELLLDAGADPNAGSPLMVASFACNEVVAEKLLKAGADPAFRDDHGKTPASESCDRGKKGCLEVCTMVRNAEAQRR